MAAERVLDYGSAFVLGALHLANNLDNGTLELSYSISHFGVIEEVVGRLAEAL